MDAPGAAKDHSLPRRIGSIAVDPFDPLHIRTGGVTHSETDPAECFIRQTGASLGRGADLYSQLLLSCGSVSP
jgi:hypothetical protein